MIFTTFTKSLSITWLALRTEWKEAVVKEDEQGGEGEIRQILGAGQGEEGKIGKIWGAGQVLGGGQVDVSVGRA